MPRATPGCGTQPRCGWGLIPDRPDHWALTPPHLNPLPPPGAREQMPVPRCRAWISLALPLRPFGDPGSSFETRFHGAREQRAGCGACVPPRPAQRGEAGVRGNGLPNSGDTKARRNAGREADGFQAVIPCTSGGPIRCRGAFPGARTFSPQRLRGAGRGACACPLACPLACGLGSPRSRKEPRSAPRVQVQDIGNANGPGDR